MTGVAGVIAPSMVRAPEGPVPCARRADWRFLLPAPSEGRFDRLVLLGGSTAVAELVVRLGIAQQVDDTAAGKADAVVVLSQASREIERAGRLVRPGGVFYCEVDRRSAHGVTLTPGRVLRCLRRVGLTSTRLYWVVPGFDDPKRFIPLDVPAAIEWYLGTIYRQFSLARVAAATVVGAWTRGVSRRFAPLAPCFSVVAAHAGGARPVSVFADTAVRSAVRDPAGVALLTSGQDDGSRVVLLPFERGGCTPAAVVKVSRLPAFNGHTVLEHETLAKLWSSESPDLRGTVPRPAGVGEWNGLAVGVEAYASGPTVLVSTGRWGSDRQRRMDDLRRVTAWLAEFNRQWQLSSHRWLKAEVRRWVEAPIRSYRRVFGAGPLEQHLFALTAVRADDLVGATLPTVLQHGDFGPWHVHSAGGRLTVVDWEMDGHVPADRMGPALMDLIYFVTYWSHAARRQHGRQAELEDFVNLFITPPSPDCELLAAGREALRTYMRRFAIDPGFLPMLNVLTWVRHALNQHARGMAGPRGANPFLGYVHVLARHAEQLFCARD